MGVGKMMAIIGAGAAAMYFLDAKAGSGRRKNARRMAQDVGSRIADVATRSPYSTIGRDERGQSEDWSGRTRAIVGGVGAGLAVWGVLRHDNLGKVMTSVGGLMLSRGISNRGAKNLVTTAAKLFAV